MPARRRLIIFTRYPRPGACKRRLIPALGPAGAAALQRSMTQGILAWARLLARHRPGLEIEVCSPDGDSDRLRAWLGPGLRYRSQGPGDLGRRMYRALARARREGCGRAVLVGSDIPGLTDRIMAQALDALERCHLVLGPARDGGYYLVGMKRPRPELFQGLRWGGPRVLARTRELARRSGLETRLLPELGDLDRPRDLPLWAQAPPVPACGRIPGSLSVIVPTLNEAPRLARALAPLLADPEPVEVIVADGGSRDGTRRRAWELGALCLRGPRGRGGQMAAGAARATGENLLFLHADTRLPPGWRREVTWLLARPGVSLGAFSFAMDLPGRGPELIRLMVRWRSRLLQLPYGDQALFLRACTLERLGGFPPLPLMEDVELVARARGLGRVVISPLSALSSGRRWRQRGLWRNTLGNWATMAAYTLGTDPALLERRYYGRFRPG